ncbi:MAG: recombination protein RecR [Planctomycetaceae bacterium]|nr:recombination protein RecR [Planctomycetaceae bacterium]
MAYPEPLERLVAAFECFPGVGRRSAERLAFHVLRDPKARELARAIEGALSNLVRCSVCGNPAAKDPCELCADPERDGAQLLVVEEPRDVEALERARVFRGRYHVLLGAMNPAQGVDARHLALGRLVERIRRGGIEEVILGTDPDQEGEATARLVLEAIEDARLSVRVTRLARGLPAGSAIEYLHRGVLEDALEGRVPLRRRAPPAGKTAPGRDDTPA